MNIQQIRDLLLDVKRLLQQAQQDQTTQLIHKGTWVKPLYPENNYKMWKYKTQIGFGGIDMWSHWLQSKDIVKDIVSVPYVEIKERLIQEAKQRYPYLKNKDTLSASWLVSGMPIFLPTNFKIQDQEHQLHFRYLPEKDSLTLLGYTLYKNGEWARL